MGRLDAERKCRTARAGSLHHAQRKGVCARPQAENYRYAYRFLCRRFAHSRRGRCQGLGKQVCLDQVSCSFCTEARPPKVCFFYAAVCCMLEGMPAGLKRLLSCGTIIRIRFLVVVCFLFSCFVCLWLVVF